MKPLRSNSGDKFFHAIMIEDVLFLERMEAKLTSQGWKFPQWVIELRKEVEKRDGLPPGATSDQDLDLSI